MGEDPMREEVTKLRVEDSFMSLRDDIIFKLGKAQRAEAIAHSVRQETRAQTDDVTALGRLINDMQRSIVRINGRLDNPERA